MRRHPSLPLLAAPALLLALADCASGGDSESTKGDSAAAGGGAGAGGSAFSGGSGGTGAFGGGAGVGGSGGTPPPPPEHEVESSFRSPVATGHFVWTANPVSGRVARVDATTLDVQTVEAGDGPTELVAIPTPGKPDLSLALVLNVNSHDATLLSTVGSGVITTQTVEVHQDANAWTVSRAGHWAIAWSDASRVANADPTQGFQDVTLIDLSKTPITSVRLSVGYRPTRVFIADDEARAFVVTEPGISVIELRDPGPAVGEDIAVTDDPLDDPASRDVSIVPDGSLALVRRDGSPDVGIVSLTTGQRVDITLSGAVTDLDLTEDGKLAVAVVRETSEVALLPVPGIFTAPTVFDVAQVDGEVFGSVAVAGSGTTALLYTNGTASDRLTLLGTEAGPTFLSQRTVALKAPLLAVFPTADAKHAIAFLQPDTVPGAFGVVPVGAKLPPKIQSAMAPLTAVAIEPGPLSARAIVTERSDTTHIYGAYLVHMPQLSIDRFALSSPPIATGMVPDAHVGFVAQQHPEGRITFIDLEAGTARTLTGFELGSKVIDGQ